MAYYLSQNINGYAGTPSVSTSPYIGLMNAGIVIGVDGDYVEFDVDTFSNAGFLGFESLSGSVTSTDAVGTENGQIVYRNATGQVAFNFDLDSNSRKLAKLVLENANEISLYIDNIFIESKVMANRSITFRYIMGSKGNRVKVANYYSITFGNSSGITTKFMPEQIDVDNNVIYDKVGTNDSSVPTSVGYFEFVFYNANTQPVVVIDGNINILPSSLGVLRVSATDAEGDTLTYAWTQTAGEAVIMSGSDSNIITFEAPATEQTLSFSVSVSDAEFEVINTVDAVVTNAILNTTNIVSCDGINSLAADSIGDIIGIDVTVEIDNLTVTPAPDKCIFSQSGDAANGDGELAMAFSYDGVDVVFTKGGLTVYLGTVEAIFGSRVFRDVDLSVSTNTNTSTLIVTVDGVETYNGFYSEGATRVDGMKFRVGASGLDVSPTGTTTTQPFTLGDSFGNVRVKIAGALVREYIIPDSGLDVYDFEGGVHGVIENGSGFDIRQTEYSTLAPVISSPDQSIAFGAVFVGSATASDVTDGDISGSIKVVDFVNTSVTGAYSAYYSVRDSLGLYDLSSNTVTVLSENFFYESGTQIKVY